MGESTITESYFPWDSGLVAGYWVEVSQISGGDGGVWVATGGTTKGAPMEIIVEIYIVILEFTPCAKVDNNLKLFSEILRCRCWWRLPWWEFSRISGDLVEHGVATGEPQKCSTCGNNSHNLHRLTGINC